MKNKLYATKLDLKSHKNEVNRNIVFVCKAGCKSKERFTSTPSTSYVVLKVGKE